MLWGNALWYALAILVQSILAPLCQPKLTLIGSPRSRIAPWTLWSVQGKHSRPPGSPSRSRSPEREHRLVFWGATLCSSVQDHECNSSLHDLYAPNSEPESRA